MKLHGWCYGCRKMKRVNVQVPPTQGVPVGLCDECREKGKR